MSDFTLAFVKRRLGWRLKNAERHIFVYFASPATMSAGKSFLGRCWNCCACLSSSTSKGKVDMSCNQSCSAWWSIKEKERKNNKTTTRKQHQRNRLFWIQNEDLFVFLFLPLFCLEMRCVSPREKKFLIKCTIYAMKPSEKLLQVSFPRPRAKTKV